LVSADFVAALASMQIANIRRRLAAGLGIDDTQMPEYSALTKKLRSARGRQVAFRDLTMTGRMVGAMHVEGVRQDEARAEALIGFSTAEGRSKALSNQMRAPWFGISPQDEATLIASVQKDLPAEMQKNLSKK